jgi:predicted 2-oxoglutarate/Fe(II)-dependent dioxygenase YbiX
MSSGIQNKNIGVNVFSNFLTDSECDVLVQHIDSLEKGWGTSGEMRKMSFNPESKEIKELVIKCLNKTKEIYGNDLFIAEYLLSSYSAGFHMDIHSDLEDEKDHFEVSIVTYLNNDFTGGDIVFPKINFRHSPKKGDIAIFLSKPEEHIHGVETVTSGKRYVMPIWITNKKEKSFKYIHE